MDKNRSHHLSRVSKWIEKTTPGLNTDGLKTDGEKTDGEKTDGENTEGENTDGLKASLPVSAVSVCSPAGAVSAVNACEMSLKTARS